MLTSEVPATDKSLPDDDVLTVDCVRILSNPHAFFSKPVKDCNPPMSFLTVYQCTLDMCARKGCVDDV